VTANDMLTALYNFCVDSRAVTNAEVVLDTPSGYCQIRDLRVDTSYDAGGKVGPPALVVVVEAEPAAFDVESAMAHLSDR
jgi:hypothetical protein